MKNDLLIAILQRVKEMGDFKQAIDYYKQYLSIAKEPRDRAGEGSAWLVLNKPLSTIGNIFALLMNWGKEMEIAIFAMLG